MEWWDRWGVGQNQGACIAQADGGGSSPAGRRQGKLLSFQKIILAPCPFWLRVLDANWHSESTYCVSSCRLREAQG